MKAFLQSFRFAFRGILFGMRGRNFRVQSVVAIVVIITASALKVSARDWIISIILIGAVLAFEILNSAIENIVDLISPEFHPLAGRIKDLAAGAVLIVSLTAAVVGIIIFWPYVLQ
jgi:diacylglycerol kinase